MVFILTGTCPQKIPLDVRFGNKAHCLFKVHRLVCFVSIDPPFSNTQRRHRYYSSGGERAKRATPLPGEEARDRGQSWQRTCTGLEVRRGGVCNAMEPTGKCFYGGLATVNRCCFFFFFKMYLKSVVRLLPFYNSLKPKSLLLHKWWCVKRRRRMKSGSPAESLLSLAVVVTCVSIPNYSRSHSCI